MQISDDQTLSSVMLRERYRLLTRQIPTLYLIVLVCTTPIIGLIVTRGGGVLMAIAPTAIVVLIVLRMIYWRRARGRVAEIEDAAIRKEMRRTALVGPAMGFLLACAAISGGLRLDADAQAVTLVTVWMCTIASSFCLSTLPGVAYALVFASGAPLCAVFIYKGDPLMMFSGGLVVALACMVVFVVKQTHEAFAEIVHARMLADQRHDLVARGAEEAARLANSDWLTLLPNRRRFMTEIAALASAGRPFAAALVDLDGFKPINDVFGHAAGDAVLVEVGARLARLVEGRGLAARFGGDEFCLLITPTRGVEEAVALAHQARATIGEAIALSPRIEVRVDACVGVALHDGVESPADLLERADATLYQCKNNGRGAVAAWPTPQAPARPARVA